MPKNTQRTGALKRTYLLMMGVLLVLVMMGVVSALKASIGGANPQTPAGTAIGNQAAATYTDSSGVTHSVTSNIVTTIVQQVASLTLTADNQRYATAGGLVNYPHTLTNTGNGTDTFTLGLAQSSADNFDLDNLAIYADADGNGIPDDNTPITSTGPIPAGGIFKFVVSGVIPATAVNTNVGIITVTATSNFDALQLASNTDTVTVTNNAVINVTKSINVNSGPSPSGPYRYTLTYTNVGNSPALNVTLRDVVPDGMTYVAGSGRWQTTGAPNLNDGPGGDPDGINYTYSGGIVEAVIASVPAGTSAYVSFDVTVDAGVLAGIINNVASLEYNDGSGTLISGQTNTVAFTVTPTASLTFTGDTVAVANQGATVLFENVLTNTGNAVDTFDIAIGTSSFPAGTTFTLCKGDRVTPLLDTNNNGIPDTGPLQPGEVFTVCLKAVLPSTASGDGPYTVLKTARSTVNSSVTATATDTLQSITASTVDLTNNRSLTNGATAADGAGPGPEINPVTTVQALPGQTAEFRLFVNNTSGSVDTYILQGSMDPTFNTIVVPPGAAITFRDTNGTIVTNTGPVPAGGAVEIIAQVTLPPYTPPGTYQGYFRAYSPTTGASDIKHDAFTVLTVRNVTIVPNNTGQVYPGGSVVYSHTVTNNGNVLEGDGLASVSTLSLTQSLTGFTAAVYWDKNNNGVLDATDPIVTNLSSLSGGTNGASVDPGLYPGESATLLVKVYAPSGALPGMTNTTTLTVTTTQGTYPVAPSAPSVVTDITTVIAGDVTLSKTQALARADGTIIGAYTTNTLTTGAIPGAYIRYRIVVTNTGTADATNVVVSDATPAYTTYHDGDGSVSATGVAVITFDGGATFTAITAPAVGSTGLIQATIPTLRAGATAAIYFQVKID